MSNDVTKTIKEMAQLTILTNRINEVQIKNLQLFPFIFFNGVKMVKIYHDLTHENRDESGIVNNSTIKYYLTIDETQDNIYLDKRIGSLECAVKELFWKDIVIEIYFNDRLINKEK
jgi:hypothetical protein